MAEPFGIAVSAIQVAGAGLPLAKTLHTYIEEVESAQKHIKTVAVDVKLTASVLEHLGALLKENEAEKLCTQNVVLDAKDALSGCKDAFNEIEDAFKAVVKVQADGKRTVSATARFAWPFKKGKLEALQANLERLKSTLLLMLSVLSYAREKAARPTDVLSLQRVQIQNLVKAQDDATMRYEKMLKDLKKLEASDRTTTHPAPAVHGPYSPWLNLQAAVGQPSTTPPAHLEAQAKLMNQLVRCSSAISSLTASLLAAMVSHSAGSGIGAPELKQNFSQVKEAIASLVASRPYFHPANPPGFMPAGTGGMYSSDVPKVPVTFMGGEAWHSPPNQMQQMAHPQQQQASPQPVEQHNPALRDFQMQLTLLEHQNKKRLLMAKEEHETAAQTQSWTIPDAQTEGGVPLRSTPQQNMQSLQPPRRAIEIRAQINGRGGLGHVSKKRACYSEAGEEDTSELVNDEQRPDAANRATNDIPPDSQGEQQAEAPITSAFPAGFGHDLSPALDLDIDTEDLDVLDDFEFDSVLHQDEQDSEASFTFGVPQQPDSPVEATGNEAMMREPFLDSVDEVDDLVKRWTTIEV